MNTGNARVFCSALAGLVLVSLLCGSSIADDSNRESGYLAKLSAAIGSDDWGSATATADAWTKEDPKCAIAMFVQDAAEIVTRKLRVPSRCTYDYPYNDKQACDKVLSWTQDLLVTDPKNSHYLLLNGIFYIMGRKDFDRGLEKLEKVVAVDPKNAYALSALGACYGAQNHLDDAARVSEQALKIDPDCAGAYDNLGMIQLTRGNRDKALEYYKKAVACTGADAMKWFDLGTIYLVQGRTEDAKVALLKSIEISPHLMQPHWNLAGIYFNLGMKDDCIRECKKVVELAPDSVEGQKAARNLQVLGQ